MKMMCCVFRRVASRQVRQLNVSRLIWSQKSGFGIVTVLDMEIRGRSSNAECFVRYFGQEGQSGARQEDNARFGSRKVISNCYWPQICGLGCAVAEETFETRFGTSVAFTLRVLLLITSCRPRIIWLEDPANSAFSPSKGLAVKEKS